MPTVRGLRNLRKMRKLTASALAREAGLSRVTISKAESGGEVSIRTLAKLESALESVPVSPLVRELVSPDATPVAVA